MEPKKKSLWEESDSETETSKGSNDASLPSTPTREVSSSLHKEDILIEFPEKRYDEAAKKPVASPKKIHFADSVSSQSKHGEQAQQGETVSDVPSHFEKNKRIFSTPNFKRLQWLQQNGAKPAAQTAFSPEQKAKARTLKKPKYSDTVWRHLKKEKSREEEGAASPASHRQGKKVAGSASPAPNYLRLRRTAKELVKTAHRQPSKKPKFESMSFHPMDTALERAEKRAGVGPARIYQWLLVSLVGIFTGLSASIISYCSLGILKAKLNLVNSINNDAAGFGGHATAFFVYLGINFGLMLCSFLAIVVVPEAGGSGIPDVRLYLNGLKIPKFLSLSAFVAKVIGLVTAVSSGLAVGSEGPMVHVGVQISALVSSHTFARAILRVNPIVYSHFKTDRQDRDLACAGTAAGVAGIFEAPLGGLTFCVETAASFWSTELTWSSMVSALLSMVSAYTFQRVALGFTAGELNRFGVFSDEVHNQFRLYDIPLYALLGLICGILGHLMIVLNKRLGRLRWNYKKKATCKLVDLSLLLTLTSLLTFLIPTLLPDCREYNESVPPYSELLISLPFREELCTSTTPTPIPTNTTLSQQEKHYSVGTSLFLSSPFQVMKILFHYPTAFPKLHLVLLFVVFYFLIILTFDSGLAAGLFVPTLLAGSALGRLFGELFGVPFALTGLGGAAGLLAGVTHTSLSPALILLEGSRNMSLAPGLLIVATIARAWGAFFSPGIYSVITRLHRRDFLSNEHPVARSFTKDLKAIDIVVGQSLIVFSERERADRILTVLQTSSHNGFPVVGNKGTAMEGKLIGLITRQRLLVLMQKFQETQRRGDGGGGGGVQYSQDDLVLPSLLVFGDENGRKKEKHTGKKARFAVDSTSSSSEEEEEEVDTMNAPNPFLGPHFSFDGDDNREEKESENGKASKEEEKQKQEDDADGAKNDLCSPKSDHFILAAKADGPKNGAKLAPSPEAIATHAHHFPHKRKLDHKPLEKKPSTSRSLLLSHANDQSNNSTPGDSSIDESSPASPSSQFVFPSDQLTHTHSSSSSPSQDIKALSSLTTNRNSLPNPHTSEEKLSSMKTTSSNNYAHKLTPTLSISHPPDTPFSILTYTPTYKSNDTQPLTSSQPPIIVTQSPSNPTPTTAQSPLTLDTQFTVSKADDLSSPSSSHLPPHPHPAVAATAHSPNPSLLRPSPHSPLATAHNNSLSIGPSVHKQYLPRPISSDDFNAEYSASGVDVMLERTHTRVRSLQRASSLVMVSLSGYMDEQPLAIHSYASFRRTYSLFRCMGLRHLVIVDSEYVPVGILTRQDFSLDAVLDVELSEEKRTSLIHHWWRRHGKLNPEIPTEFSQFKTKSA